MKKLTKEEANALTELLRRGIKHGQVGVGVYDPDAGDDEDIFNSHSGTNTDKTLVINFFNMGVGEDVGIYLPTQDER